MGWYHSWGELMQGKLLAQLCLLETAIPNQLWDVRVRAGGFEHKWLQLVIKEWLCELELVVVPAWGCETCFCEGKSEVTTTNSLEEMCKLTAGVKRFTDHNTWLITFIINIFLYLSWECGQLYVFTLDFVALVNQWPGVLDEIHYMNAK